MFALRFTTLFALAVTLGGCSFGLVTPEIEDFPTPQIQERTLENTLVNNIRCELTLGYINATSYINSSPLHNDISWFSKWGATASLKLTADEKSTLSPGVSLTKTFPNVVTPFPTGGNVTSPQSFMLGLGLSGSADATRVETIAFTYSFADLIDAYNRHPISSCTENENGVMIMSDLKIGQFILDKLFIASVPGSIQPNAPVGAPAGQAQGARGPATPVAPAAPAPGGKARVVAPAPAASQTNPYFSTFSYEVTFVATFSANGTPTWKFAQVSANPTSPLFMASRQKTNDLIITFGKIVPATDKTPNTLEAQEAEDVHLATLIGQAVATAIQSRQP